MEFSCPWRVKVTNGYNDIYTLYITLRYNFFFSSPFFYLSRTTARSYSQSDTVLEEGSFLPEGEPPLSLLFFFPASLLLLLTDLLFKFASPPQFLNLNAQINIITLLLSNDYIFLYFYTNFNK